MAGEKTYQDMTVDELKRVAKSNGVVVPSRSKKEDIVDALINHDQREATKEVAKQKLEKRIDTFSNAAVKNKTKKKEEDVDLIEYLQQVFEIENAIYSQKRFALEVLTSQIEADSLYKTRKKEVSVQYKNYLEDAIYEIEKKEERIHKRYREKPIEADMKDLLAKKPMPPTIPEQPVLKEPQKPVEPEYKVAGFFNKKKIQAENEQLKIKYEGELKAYNALVERQERIKQQYQKDYESYLKKKEEYEEKIIEFNKHLEEAKKQKEEEILAWNAEAKEKERTELEKTDKKKAVLLEKQDNIQDGIAEIIHLESEIKADSDDGAKEALDTLKKLISCKNELYSLDIIYPKYRGMIPVAYFLDYLKSGRAESLSGAHGAYNLYESESFSRAIIGKLDSIDESLNSINETLEDIKKGQYLLYTKLDEGLKELTTINTKLTEVNDSVNSFERAMRRGMRGIGEQLKLTNDHLEVIGMNTYATAYYSARTAYNTERIAHYSQQTAKLTNALGYMIAMK